VIAATAAPISATIFSAKITKPPARKQLPAWYLIFGEDQIFHSDAQKKIAKRAAPPERIDSIRASHLGIVSRPLQVARFITQAADESTTMSHSLDQAHMASIAQGGVRCPVDLLMRIR
jgi:hypothetical protein